MHVRLTRALSLLFAQPARALCASSSTSISLRFDRSVRHLLSPARKTLTLAVPHGSPLQSLRAALRAEGLAQADGLLLHHGKRPLSTDEDLANVLRQTAAHSATVLLHVTPHKDLPVPPPPARREPPPIADGATLRLVSFFKFVRFDAAARAVLRNELLELLERLGVRGSVYVAAEGLNGQLSVPQEALSELQHALAAMRGLESLRLNVQHAALGTVSVQSGAPLPYRKLVVREKEQILTDGLAEAQLDWQRAGTELEAAEWHAMLLKSRAQRQPAQPARPVPPQASAPLLLDCRNEYESAAGSFVGAEPLGTDTFSESWEALRTRLADVPRDVPLMTFCTGGIRCVKTNAFLEQELGFTTTYRLKDGIHGYLQQFANHDGSQWEGDNFVFYEAGDGAETGDAVEAGDEASSV
jgi:predicted sulfurtransferase